MKEKALILGVCLLGILGVCYGMANKDHPAFIAGLVAVVAGYLMIRRKLKAYIRERYPSEENRKGSRMN
jgi:inner membrane protein involved in colicin E2 resistance